MVRQQPEVLTRPESRKESSILLLLRILSSRGASPSSKETGEAETWEKPRRREGKLTRVRRFSYRATRVPPRASIAAIADWEALETVMWTFGVRKYSTPCA